jgi:hypothetical protein
MNIQLQKSNLIKQIELIDDVDLLKTIKSIIDYGLKNNATIEQDLVVPEWHKEIVRERRKNAKREDYTNWDILEDQLDIKYGVKQKV